MMRLVIYFILCALVATMGKHRKFGFWGYFFCSVIFTPLIGLLLVLGSDRVHRVEVTRL
jgi:hypothetical protein